MKMQMGFDGAKSTASPGPSSNDTWSRVDSGVAKLRLQNLGTALAGNVSAKVQVNYTANI